MTQGKVGHNPLVLYLRKHMLTCKAEHLVVLADQQPTDAAPSFAPPHAAGCRLPAADTSEGSPVQVHMFTQMHRLYKDAQPCKDPTFSICI